MRRRLKRLLPRWLVVQRLRRPGKRVLLTFDDGPAPEVTSAVLERLAAHRARAVFFVIGSRTVGAESTLRAVVSAGHAIGNHTYSHPVQSWPGLRAYRRDLAPFLRMRKVIRVHPVGKVDAAAGSGVPSPKLPRRRNDEIRALDHQLVVPAQRLRVGTGPVLIVVRAVVNEAAPGQTAHPTQAIGQRRENHGPTQADQGCSAAKPGGGQRVVDVPHQAPISVRKRRHVHDPALVADPAHAARPVRQLSKTAAKRGPIGAKKGGTCAVDP
jgi:hypothetical protein